MQQPILNPTGIVEPGWLGQMFYDPINNVFYQARGSTQHDWRLVPRNDFVGSFVKLYDRFIGVPENDPQGDDVVRDVQDAKAIQETMRINGVSLLGFGGMHWMTAAGVEVYQVRLQFDRIKDILVFAGWCDQPKAYRMPAGLGFYVANGEISFDNSVLHHIVHVGESVSLRLERTETNDVRAFVNGQVRDEILCGLPQPKTSVIAMFDLGDGPRPVTPGYERALQARMDNQPDGESK